MSLKINIYIFVLISYVFINPMYCVSLIDYGYLCSKLLAFTIYSPFSKLYTTVICYKIPATLLYHGWIQTSSHCIKRERKNYIYNFIYTYQDVIKNKRIFIACQLLKRNNLIKICKRLRHICKWKKWMASHLPKKSFTCFVRLQYAGVLLFYDKYICIFPHLFTAVHDWCVYYYFLACFLFFFFTYISLLLNFF